jgi:hypothetical protein
MRIRIRNTAGSSKFRPFNLTGKTPSGTFATRTGNDKSIAFTYFDELFHVSPTN